MIHLGPHQIADLRKLADDAKLKRETVDDGDLLHALLDDHEAVDRIGGIETCDATLTRADEADELEGKIEDLDDALDSAAHDLGAEAGNFEDSRIAIECEIDRLKDLARASMAAEGAPDPASVVATLTDAVANLKDVVSTLRGQTKRLEDGAERARKAAGK